MVVAANFPSDWSAHRRFATHPNLLYLAAAAARAAQLLAYPWNEMDRLDAAGAPVPTRIPEAFQAYDAGGTPIARMHESFAHLVRRHAETGAFDPDPVADAQEGPIDPDDWNEASAEAGWRASVRKAAQEVATTVALVIADAAVTGAIRTWARPVGQTEAIELGPDAWRLDDPIVRLATCGLALDRPNGAGVVDHLVFVDPVGFDAAIMAYRPTHFRHLVSDLVGDLPPDGRAYEDLVDRLADAMVEAVAANPTQPWRRPQLREAIAAHEPVEDGTFERARKRTEERLGRPLAPRGRPPTRP